MNGEAATASERIIDVRDIAPQFRYQIIRQLVEHLAPGASIQLIADHPPKPLRHQLELWFGDRRTWLYLEEGPDVWRVRICNAAAAASAA